MNADNVIPLTDRERIRGNLVREPDLWDRIRAFVGDVERRISGAHHDAERSAVCCQCRKSSPKGELDMIGVYVHPNCAPKVERRIREPLNVYEDLTTIVGGVLVFGVVLQLLVGPFAAWLLGR